MFEEKIMPKLKAALEVRLKTSEEMRNFRNSAIEGEIFTDVAKEVAAETDLSPSDVLDMIMFEHDADGDALLEELADELEGGEEIAEDEEFDREMEAEWAAEHEAELKECED